jgi:carboxypeptidase C (cathepsin A)/GH25 family lysozyme M1 (1,4-beta-N-acetylmuramidase)/subtilisin family serine protease
MGPDLWELYEDGGAGDEVAAIIRLSHYANLPKGVRLVTQFGEIVTVRTTRANILNISGAPEVVDIAAGDTYLGPDLEIESAAATEISADTVLPTDERRPADEKATGRGVVVGVVDWGFDFAHPDFRNKDGSTRILALWDQRGSKRPDSPEPFGYGVVHSRDAINRALKQKDPYAALHYHPADADPGFGSHGTHVLSIAAGSRGEDRPTGIAPEADLVVVHNAPWDELDSGRLGDSVTLLEGIDFIARTAGDRPWVINLSMGRHGEQHDGSTLIEQGLDAAIRSAPGRAVCLSAGNYFDKRIHASGQLRPTQERTIVWEILENKPTNNQLEFWYSWQDRFSVSVKSPDGSISAHADLNERSKFVVGGKEVGNVYHRGQEPNNLDNHITIYLYTDAPAGEWEVTITGEDVIDGRFHAWIERDVSCASCQSRLRPEDADPRTTTGTICNGRRTLAVGAYNKHDPEMRVAHFSSVGPTRDGRLKPDLCAPGVSVLAARSAPRNAQQQTSICTRMSGTSMAAPHVTGTVALMFQAAPRRLRIEETHNLLLQSARKVSVPEDIPERIGIGFLDIEEAVDAARKIAPPTYNFKQTTIATPAAVKTNPPAASREAEMSDDSADSVSASAVDSTSERAPMPSSYEALYVPPLPQRAAAEGSEWAELADQIVSEVQGAQSPVRVLHELFERNDDLPDLPLMNSGALPTAAQIFDALVRCPNSAASRRLANNFQVLALPTQPVPAQICPGDILVRRFEGPSAHVAVVASRGALTLNQLNREGMVAESNAPGQYVHVIEGGAYAHESEDKYARQLADGFGRVLNDVVLLRMATEPPTTQTVVTVNQAASTKEDPFQDAEADFETATFDDNNQYFDMTELPPAVVRQEVKIDGKPVKYTATTGRLPIKNATGQVEAEMFYVAYTRDDVRDVAKRPLTFAFNGGPGSASLWLHVGAMGPRKVVLQPEGFLPPAPYRIQNNPYTLLDVSDIVFIDAIGTGFSRASSVDTFQKFWGVRGDIEAFSEFIRLYITRTGRWGSPLFLLGESYGTMRAAGIAGYLSGKGISFNGIALLSTVLNYQTLEATKTNDQPYIFLIPTFTMIAGYHRKLPADLASDINKARQDAEKWARTDYAQALGKGDSLTPEERQKIIEQMARFTGLGPDVIDEANLRVDVSKFTRYLLVNEKLRVGRFDGRFAGSDPGGLLDGGFFDPTEAATHPPFTSVFNNYLRTELGFKTDLPYYTRAQDGDPDSWNWGTAIEGFPDTATAMHQAMIQNPFLKVLVLEGYYDLATPFSAANYTIDHLNLPARYRKNVSFATYEAGHMVYLPEAGLKKMKSDMADFIAKSTAGGGKASTEAEGAETADGANPDAAVLASATTEMSLRAIADAQQGVLPAEFASAILKNGESDADDLTNRAFWQKHPEVAGKKLDANAASQQTLRNDWAQIYRRHVKPLIWLRAMVRELDKFRGTIPREFLLGWMTVESDGDLKSTTSMHELGYFQIMWQGGEAKDVLGMSLEEFPKLATDAEFSIEKGVGLAQAYRKYILQNYPSVADGTDLLWRLTKARHAASGVLKDGLRKLQAASVPITWAALNNVLPSWMLENIGGTMSYSAKLKPFADLVPQATTPTELQMQLQMPGTSGPRIAPPPAVLPAVPGATTRTDGIDVFQGNALPTWQELKDAGIVFLIHKATEDGFTPDSQFSTRYSNTRTNGFIRGAYHFYRHTDEQAGSVQADRFMTAVGRVRPGDLPPALDFENSALANAHQHEPASAAAWSRELREFLDRVETKSGRSPLVYTSASAWEHLSGKADYRAANFTTFGDYPLWIKSYRPGRITVADTSKHPPVNIVVDLDDPTTSTTHNFNTAIGQAGQLRYDTQRPTLNPLAGNIPRPWGSAWAIWQYSPTTPSSMMDHHGFTSRDVDFDVTRGGIYFLRGLTDLGRVAPHLVGNLNLVVCANGDGTLHLFEYVNNAWTEDTRIANAHPPAAAGDPVATSIGDEEIVVYRGANDHIFAMTRSLSSLGDNPWTVADISNAVAVDDPSVAIFQNECHVVYGDEANTHTHLRHSKGTWVREQLSDPSGARPVSGSAAVYVYDGALHIVSRAGEDGHLLDFSTPSGAAPVDLTAGAHGVNVPAATYRPATYVKTGQAPRIVFRGLRGHIWQIERDTLNATDLSAASHTPTGVGDGPVAAGNPSCAAAAIVHILYRAPDGSINDIREDGAGFRTEVVAQEAAADPTAYVDQNGQAAVSFRAMNGRVRMARFINNNWMVEDVG